MSDFKKFNNPPIKKNGNFFLWTMLSILFVFSGINGLLNEKIQYRSDSFPIEGNDAIIISIIFLFFGLFSLYNLLFKSKKIEESYENFHQLEDFEEDINGYHTSFKIKHSALPSARSSTISVFYYVLKINLKKNLYLNLFIKQRNKIEYFFWIIGITRLFDLLTENKYFDAKYHVKSSNKELFKIIFTSETLTLLEEFDKEYPPIRTKNGTLYISDEQITYIEGPYQLESKIFNPHRGTIEDLFKVLINIVDKIEENTPLNINNNDKYKATQLATNEKIYSKKKDKFLDNFSSFYLFVYFIIILLLFLIN